MENVTKALLIAAGVLLAIMILSLLVIFGGQLSGYFSSQHETTIIEQDTKFNAQFENYNGQTIRGNELISIMNKVVNYNTTIADMEKYDEITMSVDFKGYQNAGNTSTNANNNFKYSSDDESIFKGIFNGNILTNKIPDNKTDDEKLKKIVNLPVNLRAGTSIKNETQLQALSSEIANITIDKQLASTSISTAEKDQLRAKRNKKLQNILGKSDFSESELSKIVEATKKYYQYTQLKRAKFKCTAVSHNTNKTSARVNGLTFEIELDGNGNVKFD